MSIPRLPDVFLREDFNLSNLETFNEVLTSISRLARNDIAFNENPRSHENMTKEQLREQQLCITGYLDIIEERLSNSVSNRSGDIFQVMSSIHSVHDELSSAIKSVTSLRGKCSLLSKSLLEPIRRITHLTIRRNKTQTLLDKMVEVSEFCMVHQRIQLLLSASDYIGALDLIVKTREIYGKPMLLSFQEFKCVQELGLKLNDNLRRKLNTILTNHDFSYHRFDEFIKVLGLIDLIMQIGDEFCGSPSSSDLLNCVNSQASNFFDAYHKSSMDEQKVFLDNELWEMLPVKSDFKLTHLKEFNFLKVSGHAGHTKAVKLMSMHKLILPGSINNTKEDLFTDDFVGDESITINTNQPENDLKSTEPRIELTPFEKLLLREKEGIEVISGSSDSIDNLVKREGPIVIDKISLSSGSDDDEDLNPELNQDFIDEDEFVSSDEDVNHTLNSKTLCKPAPSDHSNSIGDNVPKPQAPITRFSLTKTCGPVLTNSSLNILRLFGRYIQIMIVLEPISYKILMKIYNLLDYYTMTVYKKFGPDSDKKVDEKNLSPKLKFVVRSIRASLVGDSKPDLTSSDLLATQTSDDTTSKQSTANIDPSFRNNPNISSIITEDFIHASNGEQIDPRKAVALESLIYLVNQLWNLQEYLESLIPIEMRPQLREQFSQGCSSVPEFLKARAEMTSNNAFSFNNAGL